MLREKAFIWGERLLSDKLIPAFNVRMESNSINKEPFRNTHSIDIPNENTHHAIITGVLILNSTPPLVWDYNFLFETAYEKIYIWTHAHNKNSCLVSDIDPAVKKIYFWKTVGSMINLSIAYNRAFEGVHCDSRLEYKMVNYFMPTDSANSIVFTDIENCPHDVYSGLLLKTTDIANQATLIELMNRDDKFFTAVSLLFSSFQIHYCCLTCELGLSPYREHEAQEPELWEQSDYVTNMESAIVQACRCAESILGKPPNRRKQHRVAEHKNKWLDIVGISPDEFFNRSEMSFWDFYLKLFDELRNTSAHSYGNIHFDLKRKHAIDAQCFAALILRGYVKKNVKHFEEALNILKFNKEYLSHDSMSDNLQPKEIPK